ncbi:MAG: adenosylcobalamin-dependent ribonucleoside-diphosphate reductase [Paracoccaceae bacterium]|nr:adenosylcobalamin-dependent ribonucleoside-diphosphate reductase [Paracoccaceae bacterium]
MNVSFKLRGARDVFEQSIAEQIWRQKYRYVSFGRIVDETVDDTWLRVARGLAAAEPEANRSARAREFYQAMADFQLLPGGRILSGCGTTRDVTLFNTFVMRTIPDSIDGIMETLKDAARTMKMGGGLGFDFSTIRPAGTPVSGLDCPAAGPLAVMDIADAICAMIVTGMGRGAMMATLSCDHPDIETFVSAKSDPSRLRNFNVSVLVTDRFMEAVAEDAPWDLTWAGETRRTISARALWNQIMTQTYEAAEPGVLFIDRINAANPLCYAEQVAATNSCAEQPLPPYGACPLASINLARLVEQPFERDAQLDLGALQSLTATAVRMLDNVIDVSRFPVPAQMWEAQNKRRIGIGITGLANALIMLGIRYGSDAALAKLELWLSTLQNVAYRTSARLAAERGAFPAYQAALHQNQPAIQRLEPKTRSEVAAFGLRNGVLTTIPPTGTTSMFAGNVSSGIEPVFSASFTRRITRPDGSKSLEEVQDYAAWAFHQRFGQDAPLPPAFVTVADLAPEDHIRTQATAQRWIDSGISKTVNCPEDIVFDDFASIYLLAYQQGCKGCTTYRPNAITGSVLSA